jgi:CYTH domain-containing protein
MHRNIKIERRFIYPELNWKTEVDWVKSKFITQCYPPRLQSEKTFARVRKTIENGQTIFEVCTKGPFTGLICSEDESILTDYEAEGYFLNCNNQILSKIRNTVFWDGRLIEVDLFQNIRGQPVNLEIFEIKFNTLAAAESFVPPSWLGEEITSKHQWSNYELCLNGVPKV